MSLPSKRHDLVLAASSVDDLVDMVCDEYESALRGGELPDLRTFLERVSPELRSRLFCELLYVEFEQRPPSGTEDPQEFYLREYPSFSDEIRGMSFTCPLKDTVHFVPSKHGPAATAPLLSRFLLENSLGAGAMGEVWKAYDPHLDRHVAVKIPRHALRTSEEVHRFVREGQAAAQLRHPNIVPVHEVVREGDAVYIVSDFIEGGDLRAYLDSTHVSYRDAAALCATIARALHYAHNRGIIHRDLKPANVLMDADARPHLTDFGLAKWTKDVEAMTATGEVLGTPAYMSPEQARGHSSEVDRRSDTYAVGVMLYEMITGRLPFAGDLIEILRAIADEPPPDPRSIRREIPRDLATICLKAMEKDPARRYATALELADDLQRFLDGESIRARPVRLPERGWRWCKRHPAVAVSLVLFVAAVAGAVMAYRERVESRRAADIRDVTIDTIPSGAEVVFVPLNSRTGLPEPARLVRAGYSPINVSLAPGDYLVVAAHANGKFHEVLRHVPRSDEGLAGGADPYFYVMKPDGTIQLFAVRLWANSEVRGMQRVEIASPHDGRREELMVDQREMVGGDLRPQLLERSHVSATEPYLCDFDLAWNLTEGAGKRLPTAPEFERILDAIDPEKPSPFVGLFTEPWEWTSTSPRVTSLETPDHVEAQLSSAVMLFGGSPSKQGRSIPKYGGGAAAVRAVRSARPRLRAADFLSLDVAPESQVNSMPSQSEP
jgi:tRNA A-37 threonylcarbamoyl transferase component Bud32